jgi:pimeloyl-ACP methyl ester carboxylesterase
MRYLVRLVCVLALGVTGCSEGAGAPPDDSPYASKDLWLCRPDIEDDHCDTADLSTTEIRPDGSKVVLGEVAPNPDAETDCFYVYPTVNSDPEPGNTEKLVPHPEEVVNITYLQATQYRGVCRMFAPLYHQMSLITYSVHTGSWETTEYFERAYNDVVEAFEYYMRVHNKGRDFVLIGHSQGSHVLRQLLIDRFDDDDELRGQLVSALLLGHAAAVQVPEGEVVGGSFANIPLCTSADETGCVIGFDANPAGVETTFYETAAFHLPPSARACVNPASVGSGSGTLAALVLPRASPTLGSLFPEGVDTAWASYPNIYRSRCADADEQHVLLVDLATDGEVPVTPEELQELSYAASGRAFDRNLHGYETYITNADLVRIVEQQIASRAN